MNKSILAAALLLGGACAVLGQSQSSSGADTKPQKLPGLDPAFMDKNSDPCTSFFQYACGNFSKLHPIPADRSGYGTLSMLFDYNEYILHTILDKAAAGGADRTPNEQKIGDYYASCLDTAAIDREGLKGLQPELDRIAAVKTRANWRRCWRTSN